MKRLAAALLALALAGPAASAGAVAVAPRDDARVEAQPAKRMPPIDRAALTAALAKRRAHNLASFRAYRKGGVYPHNSVRPGPLNVWIDADGHLCAAATMIAKDDRYDLVNDTAAASNNIRLLDVTDGPLLDWILTSGFTLEEIDRIQLPGDMPVVKEQQRNPRWRLAEDARLRRAYAATDAFLVAHRKAGLDAAVTRLMAHPALAQLVLGSS